MATFFGKTLAGVFSFKTFICKLEKHCKFPLAYSLGKSYSCFNRCCLRINFLNQNYLFMKQIHSYSVLIIALFTCIFYTSEVKAQGSKSILSDTVSAETANARRTQITVVNYDVDKLSDLLALCKSKGIMTVQFIFAQIREQDTAQYFRKHSNVAKVHHPTIIGKSTLLLKIPRSAFDLALNTDPRNNEIVQKMKGGGLALITESYAGVMSGDGYLYFDSGFICPPPDNCNSFNSNN